ncbi:hypothetical protein [Saccharicrinis aurantiacus]|uniref:hypothetical protein n=1 Tax=Saccharicrinis aurantiacus TaxID=1849719 RepID=UPI00094F86DA|nr:hypothetical protein [Saccharicrinis aurantiacus]
MELSNSNKAALLTTGIKIGVPMVAIGVGIILVKRMLKKNADGTSTRTAPSLKETHIQKNNLTITTSDAALFANTLYGAMLDFGTDEKTIFSILDKIKTKDDMLLVIKTFGMKMYLWGSRAAFLGQNYNLIGWFRFELGTKEIAQIKPKFDEWGIPL